MSADPHFEIRTFRGDSPDIRIRTSASHYLTHYQTTVRAQGERGRDICERLGFDPRWTVKSETEDDARETHWRIVAEVDAALAARSHGAAEREGGTA